MIDNELEFGRVPGGKPVRQFAAVEALIVDESIQKRIGISFRSGCDIDLCVSRIDR